MLQTMWDEVKVRMDERPSIAPIVRTKDRIRVTAEIFTPSDLVIEMIQRLPIETFSPGRTVLDPACGDGQFLVAAKWVKILHFEMSEKDALRDIFGIDIMPDNVEMCRKRLRGGTIAIGDALNPMRVIAGQTEDDQRILRELFGHSTQLGLFDS